MADPGTPGTREGRAAATVAVVSWNTRDLLARCLDSLAPYARRGRVDVVVVDNGSTDGSAEEVSERFPWATLIRAERNLGFGSAANRGLAGAKTEWVTPANADIEVTPGALEHLLELGGSDPRIGVVAPRLELPDGTTQESVYAFPRLSATIASSLGLHRLSPTLEERIKRGRPWNPDEQGEVEAAIGAFLLVRRAAFESVGGFDPKLWLYGEDVDLCWRLRRRGWSTVYTPGATVRHFGGASARRAFGDPRGARETMRAYYGWLRLRRGAVTMWMAGLITMAGGLIRVVAYGMLGGLGVERATTARKEAADWLRLNADALRTAWARRGGDHGPSG